jgi:poly-gamma-glutamate capsule biosynthesis protein CapA/YwtB (metallophosphatase superfamily)
VILVAALTLSTPWTYVCGGDIMLNGIAVNNRPLDGVAEVFRKADIGYANLEIPLTDAKAATQRKTARELKAKSQFILSADPGHIESLRRCSLTWVSLGNNHTMDRIALGLGQMLKLLGLAGISHAGAGGTLAEASAPAITTKPNTGSVGLLSYLGFQATGSRWKCTPATATQPGVAEIDLNRARIQREVQQAKQNCGFLSVAIHWGIERHSLPSAYQVSLGRAFVDAGADLVIGSHPHVLQGAEVYRGKLILYSMGNLVSPKPGETGLVRISYAGRSLKGLEFFPCVISGGRVSLTPKGVDFQALCAAVARKYPNKHSRAPKVRQGTVPAAPKSPQ